MTSSESTTAMNFGRSNCSGELSLQDLSLHDVKELTSPAPFIFKLPNEMLGMILEFIAISDNGRHGPCRCMRPSTKPLKDIMLVCRRFYRVAVPVFYRNIEFRKCQGLQPYKSLRRYIKKRPEHFKEHCRYFTFTIEAPVRPGPDARLARELLQALPNIQCLRLNDWWKKRLPPICDSLVMLPKLRHLHVGRLMFHRDVLPALQRITLPLLTHLSILSKFTGDYTGGDGLAPLESNLGTAQFTRLSFLASVGYDTNWALEQLIKWPEAVHHFDINGHYFRPRDYYSRLPPPKTNQLTMSLLHSMLLNHKHTLRTLRLDHLFGDFIPTNHQIRSGFNTYDFPNLEELALSRWDMHDFRRSFSAYEDSDHWLSPSIKTFRWIFGLCYLCGYTKGVWNKFGSAEEDWVYHFALAAKEQGKRLEKIVIEHELETDVRPVDFLSEEFSIWPWDRLKELHKKLGGIGIVLEYPTPPFSKGEWVQADRARLETHLEHARREMDTFGFVLGA